MTCRMGDKARSQRSRERRAGPAERTASMESAEAARLEKAERNRAYQRRHRERYSQGSEGGETTMKEPTHDAISSRDASRFAQKIVQSLSEELNLLPGPSCRQIVLEKVLRHRQVLPLLPYYYPRHIEAKSIHYLIQSFRAELQSLSIPFSNNMLSRRGALLDAAVSGTVDGVRALARVLGTKPDNIQAALERREEYEEGAPRFALLRRQKRGDGSSNYTVTVVQAWWHSQTRVSPNRKDVVNKGGGLKRGGETHPKHYLTVTQVRLDTASMYFDTVRISSTSREVVAVSSFAPYTTLLVSKFRKYVA